MSGDAISTIELDLPALSGAFSARLQDAGVPAGAERAVRFAQALTLVRPESRRRLYWTARSVFVAEPAHARAFDAVFADVFGAGRANADVQTTFSSDSTVSAPELERRQRTERDGAVEAPPPGATSGVTTPAPSSTAGDQPAEEIEVPTLASEEELLREKRFDALAPEELDALYKLMAELRIATPSRRARRARSDRHGERIDVRRTLRRSMRTGGDAIHLARRRRRVIPRRMVVLCDISGSMEPYARAYLQFLTCATGTAAVRGRSGANRSEAFVFATRLTRLTRALSSRSPERAIQLAAAAAPDWSSGTRIGDALKSFNDRYGQRGMARGAVIVILSDGWERGAPELVGREMQRLRRLAYRIVWVNPRAGAAGFTPQAGGMLAALPYCDALLGGQSLSALEDVVKAIGCDASQEPLPGSDWEIPEPVASVEEDEPWGSATPVAGSSVAMPSGWSPSRGNTTDGWSIG
jgi:uncharacterized protein with von Willebrand factor type A (vWA) domain